MKKYFPIIQLKSIECFVKSSYCKKIEELSWCSNRISMIDISFWNILHDLLFILTTSTFLHFVFFLSHLGCFVVLVAHIKLWRPLEKGNQSGQKCGVLYNLWSILYMPGPSLEPSICNIICGRPLRKSIKL